MSQLNNFHWTADEDLLERFVLNRVEPQVRGGLEAHLLECEECRRAVLAEQQIAAGICRAGREALKARLKHRTRVLPLRQVNWYQVAGIAATIVIVVTLGIHYRWFFGSRVEEPVITEQEQLKAAEPEEQAKRAEEHLPSPAEKKDTERRPTTIPQAEVSGASGTKKARPDLDVESSRRVAVPSEEKGKEAKVEQLQLAAAAPAKKGEAALDQSAIGANSIWVEGQVLSLQLPEAAAPQYLMRQDEKQTDRLRAQKMVARGSKGEQKRGLAEAEGERALVVEQRPISSLPVTQRMKQQASTVQALLQRTEESISVTLYLDPPVNELVLQNAVVNPVGEDSIIVKLGSQLIGYKLPPGWSAQIDRLVRVKK